MRRQGFTLIELLVVIAIISLLVSILMPSLTKVKELARRTVCASNLKNIGTACNVYAEEYNGFLPLHMTNPDGAISPSSAPGFPWRSYVAYWTTWADSLNLAILNELGMVGKARMFYCPSQTSDGFTWTASVNNGPMSEDIWAMPPADRHSGNYYVRTGYMYNPYPPSVPRPYDTLAEFPSERTLALDILMDQSTVAHNDAPGWNLLSGGGGVTFKTSQDTYDFIINPVGNQFGVYSDYTGFHGALHILEDE